MKTTAIRNFDTDTLLQDTIDSLVRLASQGDRRAIAAVFAAFRPTLVKEAQDGLGPFKQDAEDVVGDFFLHMLEGGSPFVPAHGRAIPWMCNIVRTMARRHRAKCEHDWGKEDEP